MGKISQIINEESRGNWGLILLAVVMTILFFIIMIVITAVPSSEIWRNEVLLAGAFALWTGSGIYIFVC